VEFPALMPKELSFCLSIPKEDSLFEKLIKKPNELTLFFEVAADDETWSENHAVFMTKLLEWLTNQSYHDKLAKSNYQKAAYSIQKHYSILKFFLTENITIKLSDAEISMNGLLLAAASDFFKDLIVTAASRDSYILSFPQLNKSEFSPIQEYICTGNVVNLKTKGVEEIIELIKRAKGWELDPLSIMAEYTLKKYLNRENVFDMLAQAKKENWTQFNEHCVNFINEQSWGFKLSIPFTNRLAFQFLDFHQSTINFFEELRPMITDLICNGDLIDQPQFGLILLEQTDLFLLDISRTKSFSSQLQEIPKKLQALNLSECPWISKETLKSIFTINPNIKQLFLRNDVHLNYLFWGEVAKLKSLTKLDVSNCTQLQESDLDILLQGLTSIRELSLNGCKRIGEAGFLNLAKRLSRLIRLDISRTNISDTALVEIISRCHHLTKLDISSCSQLTEKGILAAVKSGLSLQSINIDHCHISESKIDEIKSSYPQLNLSQNLYP
jgi:hypothetical protein